MLALEVGLDLREALLDRLLVPDLPPPLPQPTAGNAIEVKC